MLDRLSTKLRQKLRLEHSLNELDPELVARDEVFRAPPLTPALVSAINLIAPQFHLRTTERSRRFWELQQNGACWGEYDALRPFMVRLGTPTRVLEIGPGLGRSAVFFKKVCGWDEVPFHLYESTGEATKYTRAGPRVDDSFCGNLEALRIILGYNEVDHVEIFDAAEMEGSLAGLPGRYDFIYSFFAVGFHWSIGHFLDEILALMHDRSIGAFTLHDRFKNFDELGNVPNRVVDFRRSWSRGRTTRMLILAKAEEMLT